MAVHEQRIPRINSNDDEVEVLRWYAEDGQRVEKDGELCDLGTSKATVTIESEVSGYVRRRLPEGVLASIGAILVEIHDSLESAKQACLTSRAETIPSALRTAAAPTAGDFGFTRLSKRAQQSLQGTGIALESIVGRGLVTQRDLLAPKATEKPASFASAFVPDMGKVHRSERVKLAKAAEIESLSIGQSGNVNSSLTVQFPSAAIIAMLKREKAFHGSMLPLILFEFAKLLRENPSFNAFYHTGEINYYNTVDIGIAMDMGAGLKVPVIRNADKKMPAELDKMITEFIMKLVANKLGPADVAAGTATVTDLSGQDIFSFQPLLDRQQAVILGIGGDASVEGAPMTFTMTFDHRVLTGRTVASFLNRLKNRLLNYPAAL